MKRKAQILALHRRLEDSLPVKAEQNACIKLIDDKGYTREEAFLLLAQGYVRNAGGWDVYDAASSAKEWRRELADAS